MSKAAALSLADFDRALMPVPGDFRSVYVVHGKEKLEEYYGVRKTTVERWLSDVDEGLLKQRRRAFVRQLRLNVARPKRRHLRIVGKQDRETTDPALVAMAAQFLRMSCNGGWMVSRTRFGDWRVGIGVKSASELVGMAARKGFDVKAAEAHLRVVQCAL